MKGGIKMVEIISKIVAYLTPQALSVLAVGLISLTYALLAKLISKFCGVALSKKMTFTLSV